MKLELHVYNHYPEIEEMASAIENLRLEVANAVSGEASARKLIEGMVTRLEEMRVTSKNYDDLQSEVNSLSAELAAGTASLAAAVVQPAAGEPVPAPAPAPVPAPEPAPVPAPEPVPAPAPVEPAP